MVVKTEIRSTAVRGNDVLKGGEGDDVLNGGEGSDTVDYSGNAADADPIIVTIGAAEIEDDGFGDEDTLISIENVTGGPGGRYAYRR